MSSAVLSILGAGGHAQVVADAALMSGGWSQIKWYDDDRSKPLPNGWVVSGTIESFFSSSGASAEVALGIGLGPVRRRLWERAVAAGFRLPGIVHPGAVVSRFATVEQAAVVFAGAVVNPCAAIRVGAIVSTASSVDHHCDVGAFAHICPGANLAGNVTVGEMAWVGIGSSVSQKTIIGAESTVGAGAVVIHDVPAGVTVVGVPARIVAGRTGASSAG